MLDASKQRSEILPLCIFRSGQRKRTKRSPVKAAIKRNQLVALGRVARQLDGAFDGFRAGISEEYFFGFFSGQRAHQTLRELRHVVVIKVRAGNVNQFRCLFLDGLYYFRMAVPGRANRDACGKIQKGVSVHVFDDCAVAFLGHQWVFTGERRRHVLGVGGNDLLRFRTRQRRDETGCFHF